MNFKLPQFGLILIVLGTIGFLVTVIMSYTPYAGMDNGSTPAASFLSIMLGVAFAFPSMLKGPTKDAGFSTMRITVFSVVLLFCTIYMKIGWSISKYEDLTIDKNWIYILGLAFGSKAFQRFTESEDDEETASVKKEKKVTVEETHQVAGSGKGKDTSNDLE